MLSILITTYVSVLIAELIADPMEYTIAILSTRFTARHVLAGASLAIGGKMLAAVLFGGLIMQLPHRLVDAASACTFFLTAVSIWYKNAEEPELGQVTSHGWSNGFAVSFTAIFFSEWADIGQLTTAALVARFHVSFLVWAAATLALISKGLVAVVMGTRLRAWVPSAMLRVAIASWFLALGTISLFSMLGVPQRLADRVPVRQERPPLLVSNSQHDPVEGRSIQRDFRRR